MLFRSFKHNSKAKKITNFKFVIVVAVFFVLNNWSVLNNFFNIFNGQIFNYLSLENLVMELLQLGKVVSSSFMFSLSLFAIFINLAFLIVIAFMLYVSFKHITNKKVINKNTNCYTGATVVNFATNDIYLKNDRFIC